MTTTATKKRTTSTTTTTAATTIMTLTIMKIMVAQTTVIAVAFQMFGVIKEQSTT